MNFLFSHGIEIHVVTEKYERSEFIFLAYNADDNSHIFQIFRAAEFVFRLQIFSFVLSNFAVKFIKKKPSSPLALILIQSQQC